MLAFTFPGQGSQRPGMGAPWSGHPSWDVVARASEVVGRDVARLLLEADAEELKETRNAQLATFVTSLMVLDAVQRAGAAPAACAGHSVGEYTALTAAGILSPADGVRVVTARAEAMQWAADARAGSMSAVLGLDDADADAACRRADGDVWVANFNAPGQVVVSGSPHAVQAARVEAKKLGAQKVLPVAVSGAFHTRFMAPAREPLRGALEAATFQAGTIPVVANVDAHYHTDPTEWPPLLSAQLCSPVRWRQSVERLTAGGVTTLAELGAGGVLTKMAARTSSEARAISVATPADVGHLIELLAEEPHPAGHEGEHLSMAERLVVSPAAGVFQPADRWRDTPAEATVDVGEVFGTVNGTEVRSRFAGVVMGLIAFDGERVMASQPIAWLRTA